MLKPFKSVSMLMTLTGLISTGSAYALATPEVDAVDHITQQSTCTGVVKDASGETVIGASVVVNELPMEPSQVWTEISLSLMYRKEQSSKSPL